MSFLTLCKFYQCLVIKPLDEGLVIFLLYVYVAHSPITSWSIIWTARYSGDAYNNWSTCSLGTDHM